MEDLWCFNEEVVVRAIAKSRIPTVSAVGHEIDVTLSDLVADLRALTPSEAAERIVPNQHEVREWLVAMRSRLGYAMESLLERLRLRLVATEQRPVIVRPEETLQRRMQKLDELSLRLEQSMDRQLDRTRHRIATIAATVEALSPLQTLSRGFSICRLQPSGKVVRSCQEAEVGDMLHTELVDGRVESIVARIFSSHRR